MIIQIPNNWKPRKDQLKAWNYLENGGKRAAIVAHRRWGKDDISLHFTATQMMQKPGNYWHMLPQYNQARKVIWNAVNPASGKRRIDEAFPEAIRKKTYQQEMLIETKTGAIWQLVGSDNYNTYVGSPPIGIVFSEWSLANPMAWAFISPILEQNNGWAIFIYTSRGNNHGRATYDMAMANTGWFGQKIRADETDVFSPQQLFNIKKELIQLYGDDLGTAMFNQEYMCSWEGAVLGSYFSKEMAAAHEQGRITKVPHDPGHEVDTFWDLGIDDSMSIWFMQRSGQEFNFIDYCEGTGYGLAHYAKIMKEKGYVYGNHYMPHDANKREMTNSAVAKSVKEVAEDLGIKPIHTVSRARNTDMIVYSHIPAMRNMISRSNFDKVKCAHGISCLENYKAEYNAEKKILNNNPHHDWASHGADAFRTFAVGYKDKIVHKKIQFESIF